MGTPVDETVHFINSLSKSIINTKNKGCFSGSRARLNALLCFFNLIKLHSWRKVSSMMRWNKNRLSMKMFPAGLKVSEPRKWADHSCSRWPTSAWVTTSAKGCDREAAKLFSCRAVNTGWNLVIVGLEWQTACSVIRLHCSYTSVWEEREALFLSVLSFC